MNIWISNKYTKNIKKKMLSRDTYPVGVKGPNSLCEFVTSSSCGHWFQSFLSLRSMAVLVGRAK